MDYYVKSVIPIIESNYENFTALEKNIADFFMKNEEKRSGNIVEAAEDAEETTAQETDAAPAEPVVIMHEISEEEAERLMHANRNEIE